MSLGVYWTRRIRERRDEGEEVTDDVEHVDFDLFREDLGWFTEKRHE